jgi:hypothetical protein
VTPEDFDALFNGFSRTVFRLEALQTYTVGGAEAERLASFRAGRPRPQRNVATDPWLWRLAQSTIAGKRWSRAHIVDEPLSEYIRYELNGYLESQVVGEDIRIAVRGSQAALPDLQEDFLLFDGGTAMASGVSMRYDQEGHVLGFDLVTDRTELERYEKIRSLVMAAAVPLNTYLAVRSV